MDALIIAAGKGERFFTDKVEKRPLEHNLEYPVPKTLYPVCKPGTQDEPRAMLYHLSQALLQGEIEHVYIATGHLQEKIASYIQQSLNDDRITVIPPNPSIDFTKGPLYTIATALDYFVKNGVFQAKDFDKIMLLAPSDLIIDRKAIWYLAGNSSRGMMKSRCLVHVMVEDRVDHECFNQQGTPLRAMIPNTYHNLFSGTYLDYTVIPIIAIHVDVLMHAITAIKAGAIKFSESVQSWIQENVKSEHDFKRDINIIPASRLGSKFFWTDVDTFDRIIDAGL